MSIPYVTLADPQYGQAVQVAPLVRRVIARNAGKFSYLGTGTYIVGEGDVAVIDPGPLVESHREALMAALAGQRVRAILVTHCHRDHSPLAAWLRDYSGAPTVAFGPHVSDPTWVEDDTEPIDEVDDAGRAESPEEQIGESEEDESTESVDTAFAPDVFVTTGDVAAEGDGYTLSAVHTPGHTSNHLSFLFDEQRALFSGDHIMGWSTTVITPPDGDMRDYFESLQRVRDLAPATLWPTHGAPVTDTVPFIDAFVAHRLQREAQVLAAVRAGTSLIPDMVPTMYANVDKRLHRAARRSVLAHMLKLVADGLVVFEGERAGVMTPYHPA